MHESGLRSLALNKLGAIMSELSIECESPFSVWEIARESGREEGREREISGFASRRRFVFGRRRKRLEETARSCADKLLGRERAGGEVSWGSPGSHGEP